jgi:exo-beta-1,3-glucanase (GH17 family)
MRRLFGLLGLAFMAAGTGCDYEKEASGGEATMTAERLLGNPAIRAISYSGWRTTERADELTPSMEELKEDLRLMDAMGIRLLRTYNTQVYPQFALLMQAIRELREEEEGFEMYVMLGAWIQCKGAYTASPDHSIEDAATNAAEIERAIELAAEYPEIIKIIAVGNEAMVTWQAHYVPPDVILKWVNVVREARAEGKISPDLWVTTSDNWAALGGETTYRNDTLVELLQALDYVSLHTYAFHDTYYQKTFAWAKEEESVLGISEQRARAVQRALQHQVEQVAAVRDYMDGLGIDSEIHIGETGWASQDDSHYGPEGTAAADEYTYKLFHDAVRVWTVEAGMSCFYFQAFDEPWKSSTPGGSESHFGLFTNEGKAKAVIWHLVDAGVFDGLGRNGQPVSKTFDGDVDALMATVLPPRHIKHEPAQ